MDRRSTAASWYSSTAEAVCPFPCQITAPPATAITSTRASTFRFFPRSSRFVPSRRRASRETCGSGAGSFPGAAAPSVGRILHSSLIVFILSLPPWPGEVFGDRIPRQLKRKLKGK